jgi:hypothetical protein
MGYFIPFGNCGNYIHSIVSVSNSTIPILNFIFQCLFLCFVSLIGEDLWSLGNLYVHCVIWLLLAFNILYVNHIHWYLLLTALLI